MAAAGGAGAAVTTDAQPDQRPAGASSADAYFAAETGEIAAALDAFVATPTARGTIAGALARVRTLRGVAALSDRPPLPETLDAIERAGRVLEFEPSRDAAPALGLLAAAAQLLRRAAGELRVGGTRSVAGTTEYHRFVLARAAAEEESEAADRIVPVDELFYDDTQPGLVSPAPNPPTTPTERFRLEMVSQAEHLRGLVAAAREAGAREAGGREGGAAAIDRTTVELRAALRAVRNAARSFGEQRVAEFVTPFADGNAPFDFLALTSLDEAAALLADPRGDTNALPNQFASVGEAAGLDAEIGIGLGNIDGAPISLPAGQPSLAQALGWAAAPAPAAEGRARVFTPTGRELQAFLQDGIVGISHLMDEPLIDETVVDEPLIDESERRAEHVNGTASTSDATDATDAGDAGDAGLVPIDALLYRGPAALARARALRDAFRTEGSSAESLAELFDLLDLASNS